MVRPVHLISIVGGYTGVLPHMLAHYKGMGISSFRIHVHLSNTNDHTLDEVTRVMREFGCAPVSTSVGPWITNVNTVLCRRLIAGMEDDWFVYADQDELHGFEDEITKVTEYCDSHGFDYIEGCLLDRLSDNGHLPEVTSASIWEQFPNGAFLSYPLLNAKPTKIVAARGSVVLSNGQHAARNGIGCPKEDLYIQVNHFKWVSNLLARCQEKRYTHSLASDPYWLENARLVQYCESHSGRIDLSDPFFLVGRCEPEYPYWKYVRSFVERRWYLPGASIHNLPY